MAVAVRLVAEDDASALADLVARNHRAMAPWEPIRDDAYYTEAGHREVLREILDRYARGQAEPCVILVDDVVVGRVTLSNLVRGPFQSGSLGYWVDQDHQGCGVATAAVGEVLRLAFADLGLHRVEAGTLLHNAASRRVLAKNGFTEIGVAPRYLKIAGRWQDHLLHQRLADDADAVESVSDSRNQWGAEGPV